jgi:hypothetical protein
MALCPLRSISMSSLMFFKATRAMRRRRRASDRRNERLDHGAARIAQRKKAARRSTALNTLR